MRTPKEEGAPLEPGPMVPAQDDDSREDQPAVAGKGQEAAVGDRDVDLDVGN